MNYVTSLRPEPRELAPVGIKKVDAVKILRRMMGTRNILVAKHLVEANWDCVNYCADRDGYIPYEEFVEFLTQYIHDNIE